MVNFAMRVKCHFSSFARTRMVYERFLFYIKEVAIKEDYKCYLTVTLIPDMQKENHYVKHKKAIPYTPDEQKPKVIQASFCQETSQAKEDVL